MARKPLSEWETDRWFARNGWKIGVYPAACLAVPAWIFTFLLRHEKTFTADGGSLLELLLTAWSLIGMAVLAVCGIGAALGLIFLTTVAGYHAVMYAPVMWGWVEDWYGRIRE